MQKTGSFKFRGACSAISYYNSLNQELQPNCFVTHSSGNHGQALALACHAFNKKSIIVMPDISPKCKVNAVKSYQGLNPNSESEIIFCEASDQARTGTCEKMCQKHGGIIIHPSENPLVIAGQGSIAVELAQQTENLKNIDAVVIAVGGGGMISGMATHLKSIKPDLKIIGVEPKLADDCYNSKQAGKIIPNETYPKTIADGVRTTIGPNTWPMIRDLVDDIYCFSEKEIVEGWMLGMERLKTVIEPTAGLCVAAAVSDGFYDFLNEKYGGTIENIAVVLCGGNVDIGKISEIAKSV